MKFKLKCSPQTIYKIVNNVNKKVYIGKTSNFENRVYRHKYKWKKNKGNSLLQSDFNIHGMAAFSFEVLEVGVPYNLANDRETYYIKLYDSTNKDCGYNLTVGGINTRYSPEAMEERKQKLIKRKANNIPFIRPVVDEFGNEFESIIAAARFYNYNYETVKQSIHHNARCGDHKFTFKS